MFRLFLKKRIKAGNAPQGKRKISRPSYRRNRRLHERYNVDQEHLTVLNDQDILVVREISNNGFSSDVSDKAYQRFTIGDVYDGKIRYFNEIHDLRIKLSWKKNKVLGFAIEELSSQGKSFLQRLIKPMQIAANLKEQPLPTPEESDSSKIWLYCPKSETSLFIWLSQDGIVQGWQLCRERVYTQWSSSHGLGTGTFQRPQSFDGADGPFKLEANLVKDESINKDTKQEAFDILMALHSKYKHALLETIKE